MSRETLLSTLDESERNFRANHKNAKSFTK